MPLLLLPLAWVLAQAVPTPCPRCVGLGVEAADLALTTFAVKLAVGSSHLAVLAPAMSISLHPPSLSAAIGWENVGVG